MIFISYEYTDDEFYAETVQPLVDAGMRSFNGTKETEEKSRVGYQLAEQNATAKYPVVIIPGFTTSGLELWQGKPCKSWELSFCVFVHHDVQTLTIFDSLNFTHRSQEAF